MKAERESADYHAANGLRQFDIPAPNIPDLETGLRRRRIDRVFVELTQTDPEGFDLQLEDLRRYGLPSSSIPSGFRGAETPIPVADSGFAQGSVKDAFDRKLREQERIYDRALDALQDAIRDLLAVERFVLVPISKEKARQALIDETAGEYRFHCYGCDMVFKRTADQRPRNQRCTACNQWWVANGRPETNTEAGTGKTPKPVIAARIERESRKRVG